MMTIIHANDPTTQFLSQLYEKREDISARITESSTNGAVQRAISGDDTIMMALEEGFDKELLEANLRTIIPVYPGTRF